MEIEIKVGQTINLGQLDVELREALGEAFQGLSFAGGERPLRLHFVEGTDSAIFDQADAIVMAHRAAPEKPQPKSLEERMNDVEARLIALEEKSI